MNAHIEILIVIFIIVHVIYVNLKKFPTLFDLYISCRQSIATMLYSIGEDAT